MLGQSDSPSNIQACLGFRVGWKSPRKSCSPGLCDRMSSPQRSRSAPSGDKRTAVEIEDVQSPELLTAAQWPPNRGRRPQHHAGSPGSSHEAGTATTQGPTSITNSNSSAATSEAGQETEHTAATYSPGGSGGESPWSRKTLLTLGT